MNPKLTTADRALLGLDAAVRSLIPIAGVIAGLVVAGTIENWHDLLTLKSVAAIFLAAVVKGAHGAATA